MLSPDKIEEFRAIVRKVYPDYDHFEGNALGNADSGILGASDVTRMKTIALSNQVVYLPALREAGRCCGFAAFELFFGEIYGLYQLATYTELQVALFALWLNDNAKTRLTGITCASAGGGAGWSPSEKVLLKVGFVPIHRSLNLCHGPQTITFWFLALGPDSLPPGWAPFSLPVTAPAVEAIPASLTPRRKRAISVSNSSVAKNRPRKISPR